MIVNSQLYTLDAQSGKTRFWRVEAEGDGYRTVAGLVGGKEVVSDWNRCQPKNAGRANATTGEQQALAEAAALWKKKLDRKYYEDASVAGRHKFIAPMLAEKYEGWVGEHCFSQPKLDGIRMIASAGGMHSRQGKPFSLPHVWEALQPAFREHPNLVLDGELYNHDLRDDFNTIHGLARRERRSPEQEAELRRVLQYHVYDVPSAPGGFFERAVVLSTLADLYFKHSWELRPVQTDYVENAELMDKYYGEYMEQGYEGQMWRDPDAPYEIGRRSKSLRKRKEFQDSEFRIAEVSEGRGNWAGKAKRVSFEMPDGRLLEDGNLPAAGIKGSEEFAAELLRDWRKYEYVTVRYPGLTPAGFPRFPVAVAWHEGRDKE